MLTGASSAPASELRFFFLASLWFVEHLLCVGCCAACGVMWKPSVGWAQCASGASRSHITALKGEHRQ